MRMSCAVAAEIGTARYRIFDHNELDLVKKCLDGADRIVTWNGWTFDFPVILGVDRPNWRGSPESMRPGGKDGKPLSSRSLDMLRLAYRCLNLDPDGATADHGGWKLSDVTKGLFGIGKSGDGKDAPEQFQRGEYGRLYSYCLRDVQLTAMVYEFARRHRFIMNDAGRVASFSQFPF